MTPEGRSAVRDEEMSEISEISIHVVFDNKQWLIGVRDTTFT